MNLLRSLSGARTACVHVPASLPDRSGTRCEGCGSTLNGRGFTWCNEENAYVGRSA